jgi:hypothetical protein
MKQITIENLKEDAYKVLNIDAEKRMRVANTIDCNSEDKCFLYNCLINPNTFDSLKDQFEYYTTISFDMLEFKHYGSLTADKLHHVEIYNHKSNLGSVCFMSVYKNDKENF